MPTPNCRRKVAKFSFNSRVVLLRRSELLLNDSFFETESMTNSLWVIFRWAERQLISDFTRTLFWCSMALTCLCEIAATTIMAAIGTKNIQDDSEAWTAVWFFAVAGAIAWIAGRASDVEGGNTIANTSVRT
jgi:hypothetical protein